MVVEFIFQVDHNLGDSDVKYEGLIPNTEFYKISKMLVILLKLYPLYVHIKSEKGTECSVIPTPQPFVL